MDIDDDDVFDFLCHIIKNTKIPYERAAAIAGQFSTLNSFVDMDFMNHVFIRDADKSEIKLSKNYREKIENVKKYVLPDKDIKENWIRYLTDIFVNRQQANIKKINLNTMNMNPFLIKALNLKTPEEVIKFNVFQTATRSIVTSMGFALENMLGHSGAKMGGKKDWYDVIKQIGSKSYWLQIKSGPNDLDKDQVIYFNNKFNETEKNVDKFARLGITYGKRTLDTISMNHIKSYLDNWEDKLLVGKELWDFISSKNDYHKDVLKWIEETSNVLLQNRSIEHMIQATAKNNITEFIQKYGKGEKGVQKYLDESM